MKLSAIESICKARKTILLSVIEGVQWISDGFAAYPLLGLPIMNGENVLTLFHVADKKKGDYQIDENVSLDGIYDMSDVGGAEVDLRESFVQIHNGKMSLTPFFSETGVLYVASKYLRPFEDAGEPCRFFERKTARGRSYIAVMEGFLLKGILLPEERIDPTFAGELRRIALATEILVAKPPEERGQMHLDMETGEVVE